MREWVRPEEEIGPQLHALGFASADVRWVLLTHFHTDHAGGLPHFPTSEILVSRTEYQAAYGFRGQMRGYLPQHWPTWFKPHLIDFASQPFGPFPGSYSLTSAADTSYTQQLLFDDAVDGVTLDVALYQQTSQRIRTYLQSVPTIYLPSHDPESAQRLATRSVTLPVNA